MKSFAVHYKNKYPGAQVSFKEDSLDVVSAEGELLLALRKGGNGQLMDAGSEMGARDRHDLAPIPKNARVHKLHKDGRIGRDEEAEARAADAQALMVEGKILSIVEYKALGAEIDGDVVKSRKA